MSKFISSAVSWVFGIICVSIFLVKTWSFNDTAWFLAGKVIEIRENTMLKCISFFLLLAMAILVTVFSCRFLVKHLSKVKTYINSKSPLVLASVIFCVAMLVRALFILLYQCDFTNHEDMGNAYSFASQIANNGLISENVSYALKYGRYVNFGLLFSPFFKVFGTSVFTIAITLSFLFSVSYVVWFDVLRRKVSKNTAFFASLMLCIMLNEVCLVNLFLHEAMVYFSLTAFVWMICVAVPKTKSNLTRIAFYALACLFLAIGAVCNPMGYVVAIAFCLACGYKLFSKKVSARSVMRFGICILILFGVIITTSSVFSMIRGGIIDEAVTDDEYRRSTVPYGWSLYVGGNLETRGQWSREDFSNFYLEGADLSDDELYGYQTDLIYERYSQYRSNPIKYGELIANKVKATYGLNNYLLGLTYDYSQNGTVIERVNLVLDYFISIPALFLMALVAIGAFGKKRRCDSLTVFLKAFICGLFIILLVVETSAKYVSCIWALFVVILALQWSALRENMDAIGHFRFKKAQRIK